MLTVCIVEDQEIIRERVVKRVAAMPMVRVVGALDSGEAAVSRLPELRPRLTIMDIGLPGITGVEAIAHLRDGGYDGDFIMFSVFDHDEALFGAFKLGARGYILKGEGASGVVAAIEEYRAGGAPMSRSIALQMLATFSDQRRTPPQRFEDLTEKQTEVLELLSEGLQNKEIAERLGVSAATVKQHNHQIYKKLSVNNRSEALLRYKSRRRDGGGA